MAIPKQIKYKGSVYVLAASSGGRPSAPIVRPPKGLAVVVECENYTSALGKKLKSVTGRDPIDDAALGLVYPCKSESDCEKLKAKLDGIANINFHSMKIK